MMVNGIDVSDFQPNVDWNAVKAAGYSFAYVKATEGTGFTAQTFAANWASMGETGILRGAYHYFDFTQDPVAQAKYFLSTHKPSSGDLPPMLDVEQETNISASDAVARIAKWLGVVEQVTGVRSLFYTYFSFWQDTLGGTDGFSGHPLWLAAYVPHANLQEYVPTSWPGWTIWQYTDRARVEGVATPCDANYFNEDLTVLARTRIT